MKFVPLLDLTAITRPGPFTRVFLEYKHRFHPWIFCGESRLRRFDGRDREWELGAHLRNTTDQEHDSAFAFRFELVGVEVQDVHYGLTTFSGFVRGDAEALARFHIPDVDHINPRGRTCKVCEERHRVVEQYVPPPNQAIFDQVRGARVQIVTGHYRYNHKE